MKKKEKSVASKKNTVKVLTHDPVSYRIQDVRKIVRARMKELNLTPYGVGKKIGSSVTEQTIRNFVGGKEIRSDKLARLLAVLDLEIVTRNK